MAHAAVTNKLTAHNHNNNNDNKWKDEKRQSGENEVWYNNITLGY